MNALVHNLQNSLKYALLSPPITATISTVNLKGAFSKLIALPGATLISDNNKYTYHTKYIVSYTEVTYDIK